MKKAISLIYILFLLPLAFGSSISLPAEYSSLSITGDLEICYDLQGDITLEQAAREAQVFRPINESSPPHGLKGFWIRFSFRRLDGDQRQLFLLDNMPIIKKVYLRNKTDFVLQSSVDMGKSFRLPDEPGEYRILIHYPVSFLVQDLAIMTQEESIKQGQIEVMFIGISGGILFILAFYYFIIFLVMKERSFLFFVLFILFLNLYIILEKDPSQKLLFTFLPQLTLFLGTVTKWLQSATIIFFGLFSLHFLNARSNFPALYKWAPLPVSILGITGILNALNLPAAFLFSGIYYLFFLFWIVYIVVIMVLSLRRGDKPAIIFAAACSIFILAVLSGALSAMNLLPYKTATQIVRYNILENSIMAMVLLFSLGLGDRIRRVQLDKVAAQKQAIDNLSKADKLKDEFLANTSHELRTPLTGIIGLTEFLMEEWDSKLPPQHLESLQLIRSSGKRLSSLINDILDFAKIRNDEIRMERRPLSLYRNGTIAIKSLMPLIQSKGLSITNRIPQDFPLALGDENRLQQILFNLIGNAIKFTEKGEIILAARTLPQEADQEEMIEVSVKDTGIGIPRDKWEDIFVSFEQLDGSASREFGGTGIGLTITKSLVELHGGTIRVDSAPGQGSTFYFTLPVSQEQFPLPEMEEPLQRVSGDPGLLLPETADMDREQSEENQVLIVDDDPINLKVLENHLRAGHFSVKQAQDGNRALNLLEEGFRPDLVLLDVMMPHINGYEVCRRIRSRFSSSEMPVIMLTAKTALADLAEGFRCGANDYILKPFLKDELLSRIKAHLELKKVYDSNREMNISLEKMVDERTRELNKKNLDLEEKNNQILESINYAGIIQSSLLPDNTTLESLLKDFFIIWRPSDIIGGDIYWCKKAQEGFLLAVLDCTGHSVPGALTSIGALSIINRVTQNSPLTDPGAILKEINIRFKEEYHPENTFSMVDFGMDIGICYINPAEKYMLYSGANRPLYYSSGEELIEVAGDKKSIGYKFDNHDPSFKNYRIEIAEGTCFYLSSDGFATQNGQNNPYPFGSSRLKKLLHSLKDLPMGDQEKRLTAELEEFMGSQNQRDDITLAGFRVL